MVWFYYIIISLKSIHEKVIIVDTLDAKQEKKITGIDAEENWNSTTTGCVSCADRTTGGA